MKWRRWILDSIGALAVAMILLNAPFQWCRERICSACKTSQFFEPPTRSHDSSLLCSIHWEQLLLRLAAVVALWLLAKYVQRMLREEETK